MQTRYTPRNLFTEVGYPEGFAERLIENAYHQLFEGDPVDERVCFEASDTMSYIIDIGHDDIRSEGMSYGMFIAACTGHEKMFSNLWNFSKRYLKNHEGPHKGFFSWQVSTTDFSMMDPGAAPDGEEYFAAALLIAAKKFNRRDFLEDAKALINDMMHKETNELVGPIIDPVQKMIRFSPVLGNDFTDPSYHTIAFYRAFAEATGDEAWLEVAEKSIEFLNKAAHPITGLYGDYAEYDGTPKSMSWFPESNCFSGDAWRVALNLSLDYALFRGSEKERELCERLLFFFEGRRPYVSDFTVDGGLYPRTPRNATPGLIAMNAAACQALVQGNPLTRQFVKDLAELPIPSKFWRYYDGMLYTIGLLATSGKISL
ncbi:MAG: glycoside hydrolase [Fibrobacteraceae bacterium]|nr:glycoside hydrolase [Fibrobacteraceae bacterium]